MRKSDNAPFRSCTRTPEQGYAEGYQVGLTWRHAYRPGGPLIFMVRSTDTDADWIAYCAKTVEINRQWLLGFDAGLAAK